MVNKMCSIYREREKKKEVGRVSMVNGHMIVWKRGGGVVMGCGFQLSHDRWGRERGVGLVEERGGGGGGALV